MKIVFDGTIFTRRMTGIGSSAKNVVQAILTYCKDVELIVLSPRPFHSNYNQFYAEIEEHVIIHSLLSPKIPTVAWFNFYLWLLLTKLKADVFLTSITQYPLFANRNTKYIITVNDLVIKEFAETMEWKSRLYDSLVFDRAVKRANNIWCISEYTHQNVLHHYNHCEKKRFFVDISVDPVFRKIIISEDERKQLRESIGVNNEFVLYVGSIEPRKNLRFLLKIAPRLYERTGKQVLILGANQWGASHDDYDKDAVVFIRHFVKTEELLKLYNMASCYVSTSLDEGFGMPQLEAMKCGCPVVSPNNSAMTEVVSGYGTLVDGWDEDIWIEAIISEMSREHEPYTGEKYDWKHIIGGFVEFCKK